MNLWPTNILKWTIFKPLSNSCVLNALRFLWILRTLIILSYWLHRKIEHFLNLSGKDNITNTLACLPNGLACAPRLFTKILKPIYARLHSLGHISMGHIDDSFLVGYTHTTCQHNIQDTVDLFTSLDFAIHPGKSALIPTQEFLGF